MKRSTTPNPHAVEPGCFIDSHHGHYCMPEVIKLGVSLGFILDPFAAYVLDDYDEHYHSDRYPTSAIDELVDDVERWLNDKPGEQSVGQNPSPTIPDGFAWSWNDGDFGLYPIEED